MEGRKGRAEKRDAVASVGTTKHFTCFCHMSPSPCSTEQGAAARTPERRAGTALQLQVPTQPSVGMEGKGPAVGAHMVTDCYSRQQRTRLLILR